MSWTHAEVYMSTPGPDGLPIIAPRPNLPGPPEDCIDRDGKLVQGLLGKPKGEKRILQERGLWRQGMIQAQSGG